MKRIQLLRRLWESLAQQLDPSTYESQQRGKSRTFTKRGPGRQHIQGAPRTTTYRKHYDRNHSTLNTEEQEN